MLAFIVYRLALRPSFFIFRTLYYASLITYPHNHIFTCLLSLLPLTSLPTSRGYKITCHPRCYFFLMQDERVLVDNHVSRGRGDESLSPSTSLLSAYFFLTESPRTMAICPAKQSSSETSNGGITALLTLTSPKITHHEGFFVCGQGGARAKALLIYV